MTFRRQAANCGSLDWVCVDPALYNKAFVGAHSTVPLLPDRFTPNSRVPARPVRANQFHGPTRWSATTPATFVRTESIGMAGGGI